MALTDENNANQRVLNSDIYTRRYLDSLLVEMRIVDSDLASTKMDFFGTECATPIMYGVMGGYRNDPAKLKELVEATIETRSVLWVSSHMSEDDLKMCLDLGAKVVQVVKPFVDNDEWIATLKRAEELGCIAVASDIDHAYGRNGEYDTQMGHTFGPKSSEQLKAAVAELKVPFIAKGVLSVQDAVKCKEAGADAVLLSHHHSIMDCAVPPVMILPDVRKAVGDDYNIIVDCSIDSGADAFRALALGANSVCSARAIMKELPKGKDEVVAFVNKMTGELRHFMNRTGSKDINSIDPTVIHKMQY